MPKKKQGGAAQGKGELQEKLLEHLSDLPDLEDGTGHGHEHGHEHGHSHEHGKV